MTRGHCLAWDGKTLLLSQVCSHLIIVMSRGLPVTRGEGLTWAAGTHPRPPLHYITLHYITLHDTNNNQGSNSPTIILNVQLSLSDVCVYQLFHFISSSSFDVRVDVCWLCFCVLFYFIATKCFIVSGNGQ